MKRHVLTNCIERSAAWWNLELSRRMITTAIDSRATSTRLLTIGIALSWAVSLLKHAL